MTRHLLIALGDGSPKAGYFQITGARHLQLQVAGDSRGEKVGYHSNHQGGGADAAMIRSTAQ